MSDQPDFDPGLPMEFERSEMPARDGVPLAIFTGVVTGPIRANVLLTHGRGEYSRRYGHVALAMAKHGLRLITYDLRGHGYSEGRRGDVPSYDALLDDLELVLKRTARSDAPLFLFGHSLGGQITLNFLLQRQVSCRGAVITSPYLRLAFAPKRWRIILANLLRPLWPSFTQNTPIAFSRLSRDQAHLSSFPDLHLMHHRISARMYEAITRGAAGALAGAPFIQTPLLLIHGSDDSVTSAAATREFFARAGSPDKTLRIYPGMLHEPHNEIGREEVLQEIITWIEARAGKGEENSGIPGIRDLGN